MRKRWLLKRYILAYRVLNRFPLFLCCVIGYSLIYPLVLFRPLLTQLCRTPFVCFIILLSGDLRLLHQHILHLQTVVRSREHQRWGVQGYQYLLDWLWQDRKVYRERGEVPGTLASHGTRYDET